MARKEALEMHDAQLRLELILSEQTRQRQAAQRSAMGHAVRQARAWQAMIATPAAPIATLTFRKARP